MSFAYPWALFIFIFFLLAHWLLQKGMKTHYISDIALAIGKKRNRFLDSIKFAGILCIVCALAKPMWHSSDLLFPTMQSQIALVMDTSFSMDSVDFTHTGENRLEVLKRLSKDFVQKNPYDSMLIVAFGEHTLILNALTQDREFLQYVIDSLTLGLAGGKTAINNALVRTIYTLMEFDGKQDFESFIEKHKENNVQRSIILLTDGFDTDSSISTDDMLDIAIKAGVRIYPVSISDGGDIQSLDFIAKATGGKAFSAADERELANVYDEIGYITPHTIMTPYGYDVSLFILILGIVLLIIWGSMYYKKEKFHTALGFAIAGLVCFLVSLAYIFMFESTIPYSSKRAVFVLDISKSMQAQDIFPSRLSFAIKKLENILKSTQSCQSIIVVAQNAYLLSPFSCDYLTQINQLRILESGQLPWRDKTFDTSLDNGGSNGPLALKMAKLYGHKVVVLSDGEFVVKEEDSILWLFATPEGSVIEIDSKLLYDENGNVVHSVPKQEAMNNAIYFSYSNKDVQEISRFLHNTTNTPTYQEHFGISRIMLILGLISLFISIYGVRLRYYISHIFKEF